MSDLFIEAVDFYLAGAYNAFHLKRSLEKQGFSLPEDFEEEAPEMLHAYKVEYEPLMDNRPLDEVEGDMLSIASRAAKEIHNWIN